MRAVSYWCVPADAGAADFAAIISGLARTQGAPVFQPHLTLATFTHAAGDRSGVIAALRNLVLQPVELGRTDVFTTSLFVRFEASRALLDARRLMEAMHGFRGGRPFDPHVSLCYGPPPDLDPWQSRLQAILERPLRFDRLVAMDVTLPVTTYADVAAWKPVGTFAL